MQSFFSAAIILDSTSWLTAVGILGLLLLQIIFLIKKGSGSAKITMHGIENIPVKSGVIFVASQIRFDEQFALLNLPVKKILVFDLSALPCHPAQNTPLHNLIIYIQPNLGLRGIVKALKEARSIIKNNENIGVVTEWFKTSSGFEIDSFRVLKAILKKTNASVVPVHLEQPKGSNFTIRKKGVFNRNIINNETHWHLFIGKPLTTLEEAKDIKAVIQGLSVEAAKIAHNDLPLVHIGFALQALRDPEKLCFPDNTNPKLNLTYGKALVAVSCLGKQLRHELKEETIVGIWLPNSTGSALTNIALGTIGKISVNLNYTASIGILEHCIKKSGVKTVITAKRFTSKVSWPDIKNIRLLYLEDIMQNISSTEKILTFLASKILTPSLFIKTILKAHQPNKDDTLTIIFSSGSTGNPKGVMLTYNNITSNVWSTIKGADVDYTDCLLGALPFFHSFGYTVSMWTPIQVGASIVYQPDPRQARDIGAACKSYQCTAYLSTATFLRFCLKKSESDDFKSLRILICGAEKLPIQLAKDFESKFGILPLEGYGCTELSPVVCINKGDITIPEGTILGQMSGSIGQIIPGVSIKIVDPDTLEILPPNHEGMVLATGANVMKGYLDDPEKTASVIIDGWYITGDMGKINFESYVTLTGRLSRFAKIGGEMVPLERLEDELHEVLQSSERVCAVTCVPDITRGERILVLFIPSILESFGLDVKTWIKKLSSRGLPNLWVPSEKDFHPVNEIAVLGSGKLDLAGLKVKAMEIAMVKS
jgi:acyl-[acyl-carrier-protein]-phospholipid O-acyltransferase/long-chain-fatty-acid--[acyl-carrier-protein] ligase